MVWVNSSTHQFTELGERVRQLAQSCFCLGRPAAARFPLGGPCLLAQPVHGGRQRAFGGRCVCKTAAVYRGDPHVVCARHHESDVVFADLQVDDGRVR
jgi:hypothetical protein